MIRIAETQNQEFEFSFRDIIRSSKNPIKFEITPHRGCPNAARLFSAPDLVKGDHGSSDQPCSGLNEDSTTFHKPPGTVTPKPTNLLGNECPA
jgi:hypothetical protein